MPACTRNSPPALGLCPRGSVHPRVQYARVDRVTLCSPAHPDYARVDEKHLSIPYTRSSLHPRVLTARVHQKLSARARTMPAWIRPPARPICPRGSSNTLCTRTSRLPMPAWTRTFCLSPNLLCPLLSPPARPDCPRAPETSPPALGLCPRGSVRPRVHYARVDRVTLCAPAHPDYARVDERLLLIPYSHSSLHPRVQTARVHQKLSARARTMPAWIRPPARPLCPHGLSNLCTRASRLCPRGSEIYVDLHVFPEYIRILPTLVPFPYPRG
jgi:hypothetical protein